MLFPHTRMQEKKEEVRELQDVIRNIERGERIEREEERNLSALIRNIHSLVAITRAVLSKEAYEIFGGTRMLSDKIYALETMAHGLDRMGHARRASDEYHIVEQYYVSVWTPIKEELIKTFSGRWKLLAREEKGVLTLAQDVENEFKAIIGEIQEEEMLDKKEEQEIVTVGTEVRNEE